MNHVYKAIGWIFAGWVTTMFAQETGQRIFPGLGPLGSLLLGLVILLITTMVIISLAGIIHRKTAPSGKETPR